jgi:hypothetical protein
VKIRLVYALHLFRCILYFRMGFNVLTAVKTETVVFWVKSCALSMEAAGYCVTVVTSYYTTRCHDLEHHSVEPKSRTYAWMVRMCKRHVSNPSAAVVGGLLYVLMNTAEIFHSWSPDKWSLLEWECIQIARNAHLSLF